MTRKRIAISGPSITDLEVAYVAEAARTAWFQNANLFQDRFEKAFADYIGVGHAISLPSCTAGLHLSLAAMGVGPGDEVIVPEITWIATAAPVVYLGATPVFADVDPESWCLSAESFERAITPRTKAVIPVDLYGNLPDMAAIRAIAERRGIRVIEDSAEAIGSSQHGRRAGSFGETGTFSFHGSKTMTTGEGGMVVTDDPALYARMQVLRDHGRRPGDVAFFNSEVAYKYKMTAMQAAMGIAQLERLPELVTAKRRRFRYYRDALANVPYLTVNSEGPDTFNTYWMVTVIWDGDVGLDKAEVMAALDARGIDTRPFFHPLSSLPAFADSPDRARAQKANTVSYDLSPRGINLPCGDGVEEAEIAYVAEQLRDVLERMPKRRRA
ncbi:MAG TPA: DegT/DnrJ/EryC1/StrS family aminotransferase [Alphaproteobacteria bacterium]|nr:DegT/DnrJ/EryC1/StrS family aminotransferase [Alphaproteobacteria bacterium]